MTITAPCTSCSRICSCTGGWPQPSSAATPHSGAAWRAKRIDIENAIEAVNEADQHLGRTLRTTQKWTALRDATRVLLDNSLRQSATESFAQHTKVIEDTIALVTHVGDTSNLTLDPDLDSYYLMNVVIFQGPELSEALAQARGLGSSIAVGRKGDIRAARQNERVGDPDALFEQARG